MSRRTLIVEDDLPSRQILVRILQLHGFEVDSAATLAEAQQKLRAAPPPDNLILDILLPDGSGLALLEEARGSGRDIRIAVISAVHDHAMLNRMHRLRPDAFFAKPIDVTALMQWLDGGSP
jgi:DNA-binding NtrC family response regulator